MLRMPESEARSGRRFVYSCMWGLPRRAGVKIRCGYRDSCAWAALADGAGGFRRRGSARAVGLWPWTSGTA